MRDEWITFEELKALTDWSKRTIQLKVKAGALKCRAAGKRAANGREILEYSVSSLSPEFEVELGRRRCHHVETRADIAMDSSCGQMVLFEGRRATQASNAPRTPVTEAHSKQIQERMDAIRPLIEYLRLETTEARVAWCRRSGILVRNADSLAKHLAKKSGLGPATIWRWYSKYKSGGSTDLFDAPRSDKGKSRWFEAHPRAAIFAVAKYLNERMSVRAIRRAMERDRAILGLNDGGALPSWDTIRVFLASLPKAPVILAREGESKFNEECLPYLRRGYTDVAANEIWVSDHMICDVLTWDDCFNRDGKLIRLRLTMVMDFRSRKALGYTFCLEGSSWSITTAVRNAILRFGPCRLFYADNGKDFRKVARGAAPAPWWKKEMEQATGLLQRLGIAAQHCQKYHAQSKHVERSFRTNHEQFDGAFIAGYTTGNTYDRPDSTRVAEQEHARLLKTGRVEESPLPAASVYIEAFRCWIETEYNARPHGGEGMNDRSPNQVYDALYPPQARPRIGIGQVAHLFYDQVSRKVDSCAIRNENRRYVAASAEGATALLLRNGEMVHLSWDRNDPQSAVALDDDGQVIATLRLETLMPQSEEARPMIAESMAERRRMQKQITIGVQSFTDRARLMGIRTEREHLELAAGLAPLDESTSTSLSIITQRAAQPKAAPSAEHPQSEEVGEWIAAEIRRTAHA